MSRFKQLLGGTLTLRNYNAQVGEAYAMVKRCAEKWPYQPDLSIGFATQPCFNLIPYLGSNAAEYRKSAPLYKIGSLNKQS